MKKIARVNILKILLKNPRLSDRKISKLVHVSQPTVTRARHQLERKGIITFRGFPDLKAIGKELMVFSRIYLEDATMTELIADPSVVYVGQGASEFMVISIHKNYHEFHIFSSKYIVLSNVIIPSSEELIKDWTFGEITFDELRM